MKYHLTNNNKTHQKKHKSKTMLNALEEKIQKSNNQKPKQ